MYIYIQIYICICIDMLTGIFHREMPLLEAKRSNSVNAPHKKIYIYFCEIIGKTRFLIAKLVKEKLNWSSACITRQQRTINISVLFNKYMN